MKINKMGGRKKKKKERCLGILPFSMNHDVPSLENRFYRSTHTFAHKINWNMKRGLHLDSEHLMTSDFPRAISPESQLCSDRGSLSYTGHPTKKALSGELLTLPRCDVCLSAH